MTYNKPGHPANASWMLSFAAMTHVEQAERIRKLSAQGWDEAELVRLTGWSLSGVRLALTAPRTRTP